MQHVILVAGASSGSGAMSARALADAGHIVYASMRDTAGRNEPQVGAVNAHATERGVRLHAIELDVQSQPSADAAIERIISEQGRIHVLMHDAGHMSFGPAEAFLPEQFAHLYDVNVLGTQRVNRAALPYMRKQGQALMLWIGSTSTRGGTPPVPGALFRGQSSDGCRGGQLCG